ncbi:MAG: ABC transporter permease, partial [Bryobacteraceae bacterium]
MKAYLALIHIDLKLALRDRIVIFFNYLFPLLFFFVFAELMGGPGGGMATVVTMVLSMGVLGNGLWGAGMRLVIDRETDVLRRYKVTPISPWPILTASLVNGWLIYMPAAFLTFALAHFIYGMPIPARWGSLLALITLGVFAFRAIGLIVASVVNSSQESTIAIQLLYMPMLFLSGATIPIAILPKWAQATSQFLPASYLITGLQGMFLRGETLAANAKSVAALALTLALGAFLSRQIFRWEKEERIAPRTRLWVAAVLAPFAGLGVWEIYSHEYAGKVEVLWREAQRSGTLLIRDVRVFQGNGQVIETGVVLVRDGKIAGVWSGTAPPVKADIVEGAGKTLLPGLIDASATHLDARALAQYLYCGVTAVVARDSLRDLREPIVSGRRLGAEPFLGTADPTATLSALAAPDLDASLLRQAIPASKIESARREGDPAALDRARQRLQRAHREG